MVSVWRSKEQKSKKQEDPQKPASSSTFWQHPGHIHSTGFSNSTQGITGAWGRGGGTLALFLCSHAALFRINFQSSVVCCMTIEIRRLNADCASFTLVANETSRSKAGDECRRRRTERLEGNGKESRMVERQRKVSQVCYLKAGENIHNVPFAQSLLCLFHQLLLCSWRVPKCSKRLQSGHQAEQKDRRSVFQQGCVSPEAAQLSQGHWGFFSGQNCVWMCCHWIQFQSESPWWEEAPSLTFFSFFFTSLKF